MQLSIIIPTLNEADNISQLLRYLDTILPPAAWPRECIVVDGGSTDGTVAQARAAGAKVNIAPRGRARQLNAGARYASGELLFFLHADSRPPEHLAQYIRDFLATPTAAACFQLAFDDPAPFYRLLGWFTRFNLNCFRFGDQGLLVPKATFAAVSGFDEQRIILEDNDLVRRLQKQGAFRVLAGKMRTSARKYHVNGPLYLQSVYTLLYVLDRLAVSPARLARLYGRWVQPVRASVDKTVYRTTSSSRSGPVETMDTRTPSFSSRKDT